MQQGGIAGSEVASKAVAQQYHTLQANGPPPAFDALHEELLAHTGALRGPKSGYAFDANVSTNRDAAGLTRRKVRLRGEAPSRPVNGVDMSASGGQGI